MVAISSVTIELEKRKPKPNPDAGVHRPEQHLGLVSPKLSPISSFSPCTTHNGFGCCCMTCTFGYGARFLLGNFETNFTTLGNIPDLFRLRDKTLIKGNQGMLPFLLMISPTFITNGFRAGRL
jgi:hypothetical protein